MSGIRRFGTLSSLLASMAVGAMGNTVELAFTNNTGVTAYDLEMNFNGAGNSLSFLTNTTATMTASAGPGGTYFFIPAANKSQIVAYWTLPNNAGQTGLMNGGAASMTFAFTLPQNVTLANANWSNLASGSIGAAAPTPVAQACSLPSGAPAVCPPSVLGGLDNLGSSTSSEYVVLALDVNGVNDWEEFPVPYNTNVNVPSFYLTNPLDLTTSAAGFMISPTPIPIDHLNDAWLPIGGPEFTPLPELDTPEPATCALVLSSLMILFALIRTQRRPPRTATTPCPANPRP